jgi:hypothetical protein
MIPDTGQPVSVLAIDCGRTVTRALLIGRVEEAYRLIALAEAPSTLDPPWRNLKFGVREAVARLAATVGWPLLDEQDQIITPEREGAGVDALVVTTSASEPLRLIVAGPDRHARQAEVHRALALSSALIGGRIPTEGRAGRRVAHDAEALARLIQEASPDAILLLDGGTGRFSGNILDLARTLALACSTLPNSRSVRPTALYAGRAHLQPKITKILGADVKVRPVHATTTGKKGVDPGLLQAELSALHRRQKMEPLPGFGTLATWSSVPVIPTARSFGQTLHFLAQRDGIDVLGVNLGSATTTGAVVVAGLLDLVVRSDLGLGHHAPHILDHVPAAAVLRWLPFALKADELADALHNKRLYHHTLPQTRRDLWIEQAVAREVLRVALGRAAARWTAIAAQPRIPPTRRPLIVGGGGLLAHGPHPGSSALVLLDGLQPVGITTLALDQTGLLGLAGALATLHPQAAAQVVERDAFLNLGTVVALGGTGQQGKIAVRCMIEHPDDRLLEVEVASGSLQVIPLPPGQVARLDLQLSEGFDLGLGAPGQHARIEVEGGTLGIVVDARGRPLLAARDDREQQERVEHWLWQMG